MKKYIMHFRYDYDSTDHYMKIVAPTLRRARSIFMQNVHALDVIPIDYFGLGRYIKCTHQNGKDTYHSLY